MENGTVSKDYINLKAGDLMIPLQSYPQVTPDCSLKVAIKTLLEAKIEVEGTLYAPRMLLVIDAQGQFRGTIRRRDVLRGLEPEFLVNQPLSYRKKLFDVSLDPNLFELSYEKLVKGIREQADRPVRKIMRPLQVSIEYEQHLIKAVYEMVSYGLTLIPVLKGNRVVGILRSVEVFAAMARIVLEPE